LFKLPAKIRYALIALYDIILYGKKKPTPLSDIVRREKVPKVYVERILSELVKAGVLKSVKGAKGGFALNKRHKDISLYRLYQIFLPSPENKDDLRAKNKRVETMLKKTKVILDEHVAHAMKNIKLDLTIPLILTITKNK